MSSSTLANPNQLRPDEKPLAEYRAVSRAAVAALLLGLASALVLLTPVLGFVPVAAAITAVLALRSIAAARGQLVGRIPAIAGLCLAMMFLAWGVTRHISRQQALEAAARRVADSWLALVQNGKVELAHQYRLPPASRIAEGAALTEYYAKNAEAEQELKTFKTQSGIVDLVAAGPSAPIQYEAMTASLRDGFSDQVQLRYRLVRGPDRGGDLPLWVNLARRTDEKAQQAYWEVSSITATPPTTQ
jgi:hypothetical protein